MSPFFFGKRERRLYGVYQPAHGGAGRQRAAVICYPWGPEYTEAHRAVRWLATALAAAGVHTLRFDYFGTGDSAGDLVDGDIEGWKDDVAAAMEELKDMTGVAKLSLIGLRLGALLAARAAADRPREIDALVLWDPVLAGAGYREELEGVARRSNSPFKLAVARSEKAGGGFDVLGYPMTTAFEAQLATLELGALSLALPSRTLLLTTGDEAGMQAAQAALGGPATLTVVHEPAAPCWIETWPAAAIPVKALKSVSDWMTCSP